jgi:hypothetical protein
MRSSLSAIALLLVASLTCSAPAQCCAGKAKGQQAAGRIAEGQVCHKDQETPTGAPTAERGKLLAASGAPLMQYKIGERVTRCPKQAAEWTKAKNDLPVRYIVNATEYTDYGAALQAYQAALEERLAQMSSVRYAVGNQCVACPLEAASLAQQTGSTVKYRVASFTFADRAQANRAAEAARAAADKVRMTYAVDGKKCAGDKEARHSCRPNGDETAAKTCEHKVGETKTCCETTAKVELTSARIIAAYQALALVADQPPSISPAAGQQVAAGS